VIHSILAATTFPVSDLVNPAKWMTDWPAGRARTDAGSAVTSDSAMTLSGYFAAIRAIAEDVAKVPLITYRRLARGKERAVDHAVYRLLHDRPNLDMSSISFREALTANALAWGNGYAEIERHKKSGRPVALNPIHPSKVKRVKYEDLFGAPPPSGVPDDAYEVRDDRNKVKRLRAAEMFHLVGLSPNGRNGYSIVRMASDSIGGALAAQGHSNSFFTNGARPSGVLSHPAQLTDEAQGRLREQFSRNYAGEKNVGRVMVLEEGMNWSQMSVPPEDAQLIETRKFSITEMARWFRVPPHKLAELERATFSNIEHQSIEYVVDALTPWMVRWEQEIAAKLFQPSERDLFAEHLVEGLLRGDSETRGKYYTNLFNVGALSQNDIRERENLNPVDGGDTYYVPLNMVRSQDASTGAVPNPKEPPGDDNSATARDSAREQAILWPVYLDVANRVVRKERLAAERAAKRAGVDSDKFSSWAEKFFSGYWESTIRPALGAACAVYGAVTGAPADDVDLLSATLRYEARARAEMLAAWSRGDIDTVIEQWDQRSESLAMALLESSGRRSTNAA